MGAVFLDLDGTLSESSAPIADAIAFALAEVGMPVPSRETLLGYVGPPLIDTFTALGVADPQAALAHYRAHYTAGGMLNAPVYDGIFPSLDALCAEGHRLYLMTAKPHVYARKITAHLGLAPYLTREYGPEIGGANNDKAELLALALRETGEFAAQSVMVGDHFNDLRAGRANNMAVIGVRWGYGSDAELESADILLNHPRELPQAVAQLI